MPFELANRFSGSHLIVQPADLKLNPPESYLYVQDGLIIACGVLYALCYAFYICRTYRDKTLSGTVLFLAGTMAYEIYYAFACTSTTFEVFSFLVWYFMDLAFATVAIKYAYPPSRRTSTAVKLFFGVLLGLGFLHGLCLYFPDEREQITAFWTGVYLELPIGWGALYLLLREGNTKGHSIEIWLTRFLGCYCAFAVFVWRYLNVPENWEYVASPWSVGGMVVTLIPEHIYPFAYIWVLKKERKAKVE